MLPNDNSPLVSLFGPSYCELHNLSSTEAAVVDVLSHGRNFAEPLEAQISSLKKQLLCLEAIHKLDLPNFKQLEQLAQLHREATFPYSRFQLAFRSIWNSIHSNLSKAEITLLNTLFTELSSWIGIQNEYATDEAPNLINVIRSGEQTVQVLDAVSSIVLREKVVMTYKSQELKTEDIPALSITLLSSYISFGVAAKLLFSPETKEAEIRTIYASYASEIFRENGTQFAEFMFRQELSEFVELACAFFANQFILSDKLFELTYNQRFLTNRRTNLELFMAFAKAISFMGFPSTGVPYLQLCFSLSGLLSFDTSHNFAQVSEALANESFWPLAWLGLSREEIKEQSPEWQAKLSEHVAAIPNPDAKLWVERALKALHLP